MSKNSKYIIAIAALALAACSGCESDEPASPKSSVIMVDFSDSDIEIWQDVTTSRAESTLLPPSLDSIKSVGVFAVNNIETNPVFDNQQFYYRDYKPNDITWTAGNNWPYTPTKVWVPNANYVFVAYTPFSATDVMITKETDAITEMVWSGLSSISASDCLVSTRVDYTALSSNNEAISMTLNHLMARLRFCFKLDDLYADLRKIVAKEMKVVCSDSRSMKLTVSYKKEGTTYTPNYRWERGEPGSGNKSVSLRNETGVDSIILAKGIDYQALASLYYEPGDPLNIFNIEVVYDVYDSHDTLLRKNDHAVSAITMTSQTLEPGKYYDVKIIIEPSYLYVLSDQEPDSDAGLIIP